MTTGPAIFIAGTRPEAIKVAPLIREASKRALDHRLILTGQHADLVEPVMSFFGIAADESLDLMTDGQTPASVVAEVLNGLSPVFARLQPSVVVVQGDTASAFAAATAAHFAGIPVAHVEAGLRSGSIWDPFPEEFNRRAVSAAASVHYAPTERAAADLLREGHSETDVLTTGNTSIDALHFALKQMPVEKSAQGRQVLVTAHRRENHARAIGNLCEVVKVFVGAQSDYSVIWPVHPNPAVRSVVISELSDVERVRLVDPLDYGDFCVAMRSAHFIVTDSGGVQEEAPALRKPVLVFRERTERPEAVDAGVAKLVGTDPNKLLESMTSLASDAAEYQRMSAGGSPYGDGHAAGRIVSDMAARFGVAQGSR